MSDLIDMEKLCREIRMVEEARDRKEREDYKESYIRNILGNKIQDALEETVQITGYSYCDILKVFNKYFFKGDER